MSQSAKSLRSMRSVRSNTNSLRRSCLLSRSANASQIQILHHSASQGGDIDQKGVVQSRLPQRRCQSLGGIPSDDEGEVQHQQDPTDPAANSGRQFLCVPQAFSNNGKQSQRRRKESKSLDLFPAELRSALSDRSAASCTSQDDIEDEHTRLLDSDDPDVTLTIPNGDQHEQIDLFDTARPNGHIKSTKYQAVRLLHNEDEGIDVNSESSTSRVQHQDGSSFTASGFSESDKKWHSCEQLQNQPLGDKRAKDNKDAPITSTVNKSVKQWLVNLFGVGHSSEPYGKTLPVDDFSDIQREDGESVV